MGNSQTDKSLQESHAIRSRFGKLLQANDAVSDLDLALDL